MTNPDEVKDKFYNDLDDVISATPRTDKLILLGDCNASVGTDHQTWEGVIGPEGVGKCNSSGFLFLRKCAEHDVIITNTVFRLANRNKSSYMHDRSKHRYLIDYVVVWRTPKILDIFNMNQDSMRQTFLTFATNWMQSISVLSSEDPKA